MGGRWIGAGERSVEGEGGIACSFALAPLNATHSPSSPLLPAPDGFLLVEECLRSAGGPPNVFAAGDVASCPAHPRPKAGVFAVRAVGAGQEAGCECSASLVRMMWGVQFSPALTTQLPHMPPPTPQGPPLADNLRRVLAGQAPTPWRPQTTFLSLISAGDKYAVGTKGWIGAGAGLGCGLASCVWCRMGWNGRR